MGLSRLLRSVFDFTVPNPAAAIWIGILVLFVLFAGGERWRSPRHVALAALLLLAVPMAWVMDLGAGGRWTAPPVFTAIFLITAGYAAWAFQLARRGEPFGWRPNLGRSGLKALVAFAMALDVCVVLGRSPDDAGIYSNLGARRWVETGTLPYGDSLLKGPDAPAYGAAATYGPLMYAAHIPFQLILLTPSNPPDAVPIDPSYRRPDALATKLACLAFFFAALWALYGIVKRLADGDLALAAVAAYAASPYVIGLGGKDEVIGGLAFISHIAPSAVVLLALRALDRPALSGSLLAAAAGVLFWPAFLFPAWFGWRVWRRDKPVEFLAGFTAVGVALLALVVWFTHAQPGESAIRMFLQSTLEHQEGVGAREYGASTMSFWGTHPGLAAVLQRPLFGDTSLFKPTFLAFAALALGAFFLAKGRTVPQLAALTAMIGAAIQLWKTHATGSYVEWYYPFLLIALLCAGTEWVSGRARAQPEPPRAMNGS